MDIVSPPRVNISWIELMIVVRVEGEHVATDVCDGLVECHLVADAKRVN